MYEEMNTLTCLHAHRHTHLVCTKINDTILNMQTNTHKLHVQPK